MGIYSRGEQFLGTRDKSTRKKKFPGHIIINIYIVYLCIVNENILLSVVPILSEINNTNLSYTYKIITPGMQEADTSMTEAI
jgi:hypothetical protein